MTILEATEIYIEDVRKAMFPTPPPLSRQEVLTSYKQTHATSLPLLNHDDVARVNMEDLCQLFEEIERITTSMSGALYLRETGKIHPMLARRW